MPGLSKTVETIQTGPRCPCIPHPVFFKESTGQRGTRVYGPISHFCNGPNTGYYHSRLIGPHA